MITLETLQSILASESSWSRLQGLELVNVFFVRSKAFRDLLIDWLQV